MRRSRVEWRLIAGGLVRYRSLFWFYEDEVEGDLIFFKR